MHQHLEKQISYYNFQYPTVLIIFISWLKKIVWHLQHLNSKLFRPFLVLLYLACFLRRRARAAGRRRAIDRGMRHEEPRGKARHPRQQDGGSPHQHQPPAPARPLLHMWGRR